MNKIISFSIISLFLLVSILSTYPILYTSSVSFSVTSQWLVSSPYVVPGERLVPLQVTLISHGSDNITNVQIIPIESSPYIVYPNDQQYSLSVMIPNQQYTFTFIGNITPNIPLGVYNFYLQIIYTLGNQVYTQTITVQIPIMGYIQLYSISQVNGIVFPGEEDVPITLTIYNIGVSPASNITLFLNSTYPLQFITRTVNIPLIQAGSFTSVQVIANVYNNIMLQ